jgi:phenylalanyl-tRNA synthetase beta chain
MKASYSWLRALVPGLEAGPQTIAERLTRAGLEVEGIEPFGEGLDPVVVAAVQKVEPHPARSGLVLVTLDRGHGEEQRVVCGAPNVPAPGGLVALAPLGTRLPAAGLTVGARDIGGIKSEGMLCSEEEMGLLSPGSGSSDGILVLPAGAAEPGTPFCKSRPEAKDTIFEIGVTPNRPDALGHVGLARELAALFELPFAPPRPAAPCKVAPGHVDELARVVVEDFERCPHYGACVVRDVAIGPSPAWLRYRLASLGVRPISNIVDITNLVMLEFGHPTHAFDLDLVRGGAIVVRRARAGEKLTTLDGVVRELVPDDLLICDGEGPVALAGVMGGGNSEIGPKTRRVLVECAYFAPRGVRRTSRRHGLHTEASHRFERGVDPGDTADVLAHAGALMTELAGGAAVPGSIHAVREAPVVRTARLRSSRLDALVGGPVPFAEALAILDRLGFQWRAEAEGTAIVSVPTHRPDVSREEDLIEEVARVRGLDAIPTVLPPIRPQPPRDTGVLESQVRRAAVELGLSEAVTYGFVSPKDLERVGAPPSAVPLANPLTDERSVMRTSLLPGLLQIVESAFRRGHAEARLFTIGARFLPGSGELPEERPSFAALLVGVRRSWLAKPEPFDVWDAKGIALEIVERVTRRAARVASEAPEHRAAHLHPRGAADVLVDDRVVGRFGPLHPDVLRAFDLEVPGAVVVELDLPLLGGVVQEAPRFAPIFRMPAVTRDVALVVHEDVPAASVEQLIRNAAGDLCETVELFDVFHGEKVPADHRSLAFHVIYRDPRAERTLTDQEVDQRHAAVVSQAKAELGAMLR